jgi:transcriptional regulator with XRE-family HTH domain
MEGELQKILGRNLRRLRESEGMSQEEFAEKLGYHRTYLGGVERGERNLTLRSVERIADLTGADPISLITEVG